MPYTVKIYNRKTGKLEFKVTRKLRKHALQDKRDWQSRGFRVVVTEQKKKQIGFNLLNLQKALG